MGTHDPDTLGDWYAWRDDWPGWQPVLRVSGFDEMIYRPMPNPIPPVPSAETTPSEGVPQGFDPELSLSAPQVLKDLSEFSDSMNTDSFVVRAKKRFKKRYAVTVEIDGKVFKTHSRDISVGGVNVEDLIPDWITGYFKIRVSKPNTKQAIELQCCLVEGQAPNARYRFMILPLQDQNDETNLENWLAA